MGKKTIAFRMDEDRRDALEALARLRDRDLSYVLNEAVEQYLEVNRWQADLIRARLEQADAGAKGVAHDEVFARLRARVGRGTGSVDK
jgi:predicted transcriptional regulator